METIKNYVVTVVHDHGTATFTVGARDEVQARLVLMEQEGCPERAIRKVQEQFNPLPASIKDLAALVVKDCEHIHYAALPYLEAMLSFETMEDNYFEDSAASVVSRFLGNAKSWTGVNARSIKAQLNQLLKSH